MEANVSDLPSIDAGMNRGHPLSILLVDVDVGSFDDPAARFGAAEVRAKVEGSSTLAVLQVCIGPHLQKQFNQVFVPVFGCHVKWGLKSKDQNQTLFLEPNSYNSYFILI